jgi:hypothetical protein
VDSRPHISCPYNQNLGLQLHRGYPRDHRPCCGQANAVEVCSCGPHDVKHCQEDPTAGVAGVTATSRSRTQPAVRTVLHTLRFCLWASAPRNLSKELPCRELCIAYSIQNASTVHAHMQHAAGAASQLESTSVRVGRLYCYIVRYQARSRTKGDHLPFLVLPRVRPARPCRSSINTAVHTHDWPRS